MLAEAKVQWDTGILFSEELSFLLGPLSPPTG